MNTKMTRLKMVGQVMVLLGTLRQMPDDPSRTIIGIGSEIRRLLKRHKISLDEVGSSEEKLRILERKEGCLRTRG